MLTYLDSVSWFWAPKLPDISWSTCGGNFVTFSLKAAFLVCPYLFLIWPWSFLRPRKFPHSSRPWRGPLSSSLVQPCIRSRQAILLWWLVHLLTLTAPWLADAGPLEHTWPTAFQNLHNGLPSLQLLLGIVFSSKLSDPCSSTQNGGDSIPVPELTPPACHLCPHYPRAQGPGHTQV